MPWVHGNLAAIGRNAETFVLEARGGLDCCFPELPLSSSTPDSFIEAEQCVSDLNRASIYPAKVGSQHLCFGGDAVDVD